MAKESHNTYQLRLWLTGDEGLYRTMQDYIKRYPTKDDAARAMVEDLGDFEFSDGATLTFTGVRSAMVGE